MTNNQQPTAIDMCFKYTELSKTVDKDIAYGLKKIEELEKQLKIAKEALEEIKNTKYSDEAWWSIKGLCAGALRQLSSEDISKLSI